MSAALLERYHLETSSILTASHLLELMRADFSIPSDFTGLQARQVLGVLYELRLRELRTASGGMVVTVPYQFAEDISVEMISVLNDGAFHGAVVGSRADRQYHTDSAAHILGRVGPIYDEEERAALNAPYSEARESGGDASAYRYYYRDDKVGKDGVEKEIGRAHV